MIKFLAFFILTSTLILVAQPSYNTTRVEETVKERQRLFNNGKTIDVVVRKLQLTRPR